MKVCLNGQGHMTKMAAMAINSKNLLSANSYMKLVWDKQIRKRCEQFRFY